LEKRAVKDAKKFTPLLKQTAKTIIQVLFALIAFWNVWLF